HPFSVELCFIKRDKQNQISFSNMCELIDNTFKRTLVVSSIGNKFILFERRQVCHIVSCKPQRTVRENPFGIDDMAQSLFDCPFILCILIVSLFWRNSSDKISKGHQLFL